MSEVSDYEKDGSVLAWLREQESDRDIGFVAIEHLTDAPVEVRKRFIDELSEEEADPPDDTEAIQTARADIIFDLGYIAGYYEPAGRRQKIYKAWQEADPDARHPFFHQGLHERDVAEIARNN
ncbi:MAG TPA: hypothetical protein VFX86_01175 [Candidatus Saccharimonadales bacterium]|nr:hypothetical protein [Candidatus Saccharimonadales bacterium]